MAVANPKPSSFMQAKSHILREDRVSLDQISDTKNCG